MEVSRGGQFKADADLFGAAPRRNYKGSINLKDTAFKPLGGAAHDNPGTNPELMKASALAGGLTFNAVMQWCFLQRGEGDLAGGMFVVRHRDPTVEGMKLSIPDRNAEGDVAFEFLLPGDKAVRLNASHDTSRLKRQAFRLMDGAGFRGLRGANPYLRVTNTSLNDANGASTPGLLVCVKAHVIVRSQEAVRVALTRGVDTAHRTWGVGMLRFRNFYK